MGSMVDLLAYLAHVPPGDVSDPGDLPALLAACWDRFTGSGEAGMSGEKLLERMEDVAWRPPVLSFKIERHGATVLGSSRTGLHEWSVNVQDRTAECAQVGYRQVHRRLPPLRVEPIAEGIVALILAHRDDERLKWRTDGTVQVNIGKIIPAGLTPKQTEAGRRKRFR